MMEQHHHHQQQQQQQMGSSGGGGGLSRFQSAPTTWFDTLLLEEDEEAQTQCLSQPPILRNSTVYDDPSTTTNTFFRHNSSPPELLSHLTSSLPSDSYFSTSGFSSNYDLLSIPDIRSEKRPKELESTQQLKVEKGADFSEMEMENLFQDSVPCRIRAKRGFATHPRSIAERVRRTRISDRIRKLQEIVPNMDKQTNTADMLDEAVEYVKLLQKQIQELTEHQNKCKCSSRD